MSTLQITADPHVQTGDDLDELEDRGTILPGLPSYYYARRGVRVHLVDDAPGAAFDGIHGFLADTDHGLFVLLGASLLDEDERDAVVLKLLLAWIRDVDAKKAAKCSVVITDAGIDAGVDAGVDA